MSPENENESPEHGSVEPRVKWGINEWNIESGAISGTAPGQTGPVPHQIGDLPI